MADPRFFWTKVWGRPGAASEDALLFSHEGTRDKALSRLEPGDIVVYLTSDTAQADPKYRGRVVGAVEIEGEKVSASDLGLEKRARAEDFNAAGRFRWVVSLGVV